MSVIKLIKNSIRDIVRWSLEDANEVTRSRDIPVSLSTGIGSGYTKSSNSNIPVSFNFSVTSATGGKVITVRHYDPRTDRTSENVYIITDKEDLGQELGQIITIESLQH